MANKNLDLIENTCRESWFMLDIGAGGGSVMVIQIGTAVKGDGTFAEDCVVPVEEFSNFY